MIKRKVVVYNLKGRDNLERLLNKYFAESEKALDRLVTKHNIHLDSDKLFKVLIDHFDVSDLTNEVIFKDWLFWNKCGLCLNNLIYFTFKND